ncbi:hypothetical protein MKEN_00602100 [Mycena kentingensis (nom. inval.)]|nr:hypothetical protein MKEN_00602100 [Mycena kentingensis (nom. inval.)]
MLLPTLITILASAAFYLFRRAAQSRTRVLRSLSLPPDTRILAFFHPYCNAGGGGERVLWTAISYIQRTNSNVLCVVYTGDITTTKASILEKAQSRFSITLDPNRLHFVFLTRRSLVEDSTYPRLTLIGQSMGSVGLVLEALWKFVPHAYIDTMGYAFTLPVVRLLGIPAGAYVHYPTVSPPMIARVTRPAKLLYYHAFMLIYALALRCAQVLVVNSTWTQKHVTAVLEYPPAFARWGLVQPRVVYPSCDTQKMERLPLNGRERIVLSIAQFRPEKNHAMQIRALQKLGAAHASYSDVRLVLVGGCRNPADEARVDSLRALANELGVADRVVFVLNAPYPDVLEWLRRASVGLNTMLDEHFGINVVEFMAAGVIPIVHASGGPLEDIVVPFQGQPTGYHADSPETFAEAIHHALSLSAEDDLAIRQRARSWSVQRFSESEFEAGWEATMSAALPLFDLIPKAGTLAEIAPTSPLLPHETRPLFDRLDDPAREPALQVLLHKFSGELVEEASPMLLYLFFCKTSEWLLNRSNAGEGSLNWDGYTITSGAEKYFFFPEYLHVFRTVHSHLLERTNGSNPRRRKNFLTTGCILIGNTGIGKTEFLWFYLRVAAARGQTILLHTAGHAFLLTHGALYHFSRLNTGLELPHAPQLLDVVMLYDMDWEPTTPPPISLQNQTPVRIVGASSPHPQRYYHATKHARIKLVAMDTPTRDELASFFQLARPHLVNDEFSNALYTGIRMLGFCVRDLEAFMDTTVKSSLQKASSRAVALIDGAISQLGLQTEHAYTEVIHKCNLGLQVAIHRVIAARRQRVKNTPCVHYCVRSHLVFRKLVLAALCPPGDSNQLFSQFEHVPMTSVMRGWLYEFLAHQILGLRATDITIAFGNTTRTIRASDGMTPPSKWDDIQRMPFKTGVYYIPSNNIAFDAFTFIPIDAGAVALYTFQTTIAPTHNIVRAGLTKLCQIKKLYQEEHPGALVHPRISFVFVVPDATQFHMLNDIAVRTDSSSFDFGVTSIPIDDIYALAYQNAVTWMDQSNPPPHTMFVQGNDEGGDGIHIEEDE